MVTGVVPQIIVEGSTMHKVVGFNAAPPTAPAANAPEPVIGWKLTVEAGATARRSGEATGGGGMRTVGVMVALATRPLMSATMYFTGAAVPMNDGSGSNETVPFAFTVYVPSFGTVNVVKLQLAFAVEVVAHNFTLLATNVAGATAESFVRGEIT
jgi:hypothetical protein